ncbi:MAG TPA: signal peptidase I [Thermoanaerobaculia bacterium]|nr:signal peptidase I [Thermoanaerobaculia bacterium]
MRQKSLLRTILQPLAIAVGLAAIARGAMHIYAIPSSSMSPTLEPGDQIVVTRYFGSAPERGHVIVFRSPLHEEELLVKRVIAVPGELVDSRLGRVRIGEHTLAEPYVLRQAMSGAIQAQLVPADSYFVLGDNREDSLDSRSWGVIPRERIVGRARLVLWSSSNAHREIVHAEGDASRDATTRTSRSGRIFKWIE